MISEAAADGGDMAVAKALAPEMVALVHHVELNKAGWWETAIRRLLLTALHGDGVHVTQTVPDIRATLKTRYAVELDETTIRTQLANLLKSGEIIEPQDGHFKASEAALAQCEAEIEAARQLELLVRRRFDDLLVKHCANIDPTLAWSHFADRFLIPLVRQLGASTYQLLTGVREFTQLPQITEFIHCFEPSVASSLEAFLHEFLDPTDVHLRRFVLRTMNAFFVVRAGGLTKTTVDRLAQTAKDLRATLLFDSNVLFSLLGLHENPADESSRNLLAIVHRLSESMPIRLGVLPLTLDEMKRAIKASQESLINLRIASSLLQPALNAGLTGITVKFLTLAAQRKGVVAPADYFEPYLKNLVTILRDNGVELFNADTAPYKQRQDVIDDVLEQMEFEKSKYGDSAKNYERLEHDMILWHFAHDKRPPRPDSPIDAKYWLITADYRLLGFDAYKQKRSHDDIPLCLHPIALVQLLQFWVPMDSDLETALFSAIRLPTVLAPFGGEAEKVSLQILSALSTFENIGDMPGETTTRILLNDALRQKLALEKDVSKQIELVREALIEENKNAEERVRLERAKSRQMEHQANRLQAELTNAHGGIENLRSDLKGALQRAEAAEHSKEEAIKREEEAIRREQQVFQELERLKREQEEARERGLAAERTKRQRIFFSCAYVGSLVIILVCDAYLRRRTRNHMAIALAELAIAAAWISVSVWCGLRLKGVRDWSPFRHAMRAKLWIIGAILSGIIGNAAWGSVISDLSGLTRKSDTQQRDSTERK